MKQIPNKNGALKQWWGGSTNDTQDVTRKIFSLIKDCLFSKNLATCVERRGLTAKRQKCYWCKAVIIGAGATKWPGRNGLQAKGDREEWEETFTIEIFDKQAKFWPLQNIKFSPSLTYIPSLDWHCALA